MLQNPNVAAALVGASRPEQLADTVRATGVKLDDDTMAAIDVPTPCAIGDQTICEIPSSSEVGTTSSSMTRHSIEYCGWFEITWMPTSSASA